MSSFQIHQDAHELAKSSSKYNEGWKDNSYILLLGEKDGGWWGKKTSQLHLVLLSLFAINLNKASNLAEKENMQ